MCLCLSVKTLTNQRKWLFSFFSFLLFPSPSSALLTVGIRMATTPWIAAKIPHQILHVLLDQQKLYSRHLPAYPRCVRMRNSRLLTSSTEAKSVSQLETDLKTIRSWLAHSRKMSHKIVTRYNKSNEIFKWSDSKYKKLYRKLSQKKINWRKRGRWYMKALGFRPDHGMTSEPSS